MKTDFEATAAGNDWMTETVTSIAYKKESADLGGGSDSKKRRIASKTRQEFESALRNLYKWLDYVDLEIGRSEGVFDDLNVDEKNVVYQESLVDVEAHKVEYERVLELGKRCIKELEDSGELCDSEKSKVSDIQNCWQAMNNRLQEIKKRIDFLVDLKQLRSELASLRMMLDGYSKWFEANTENSQIDVVGVRFNNH